MESKGHPAQSLGNPTWTNDADELLHAQGRFMDGS